MEWSPTVEEAVNELRRWQRHWLLRQFGENGHMLPENIRLSACLDTVIAGSGSVSIVARHEGYALMKMYGHSLDGRRFCRGCAVCRGANCAYRR